MIYNNAQEAFVDLSTMLLGSPEQQSRVGTTREMILNTITIKHPEQRIYCLPHRNDNIFAKIAETVWVLAGRNDLAFLSKYLPRAVDFSDDGKTWRAAYGQRMRNFIDYDWYQGADQLKNIVKLLQKDRYTRRAIISLWNPEVDYEDSKDIPCNNWLNFIIRPNKQGIDELHLNIAQRSSDIMWGLSGINTFEFATLQILLAQWLQCKVGTLNYNITSLHVYEKHFTRLAKIIESYTYKTIYHYDIPIVGLHPQSMPHDSLAMFDNSLPAFFLREHDLLKPFDGNLNNIITDNFLYRSFNMLMAYDLWRACQPNLSGDLIDCLDAMPDDDWKLAAIEYVARDNKAVLDEVKMSDAIMTALLYCMPHLRDDR
jgi:thymidylate synthase